MWSCNIWLYENVSSIDGEELASSIWNDGRPLGLVVLWSYILFCFPVGFFCVIMSSQAQNNYIKQQWSIFLDAVPLTWLRTVLMFVDVKLSSRIITSKKHVCFHRDFFFPPVRSVNKRAVKRWGLDPAALMVEAYLWVQEM